jgi:uracil-DNA glycosylase
MKINLSSSWNSVLKGEFEKEYFKELSEFLQFEYDNKHIFPPENLIFNAFEHCSFEDVKVVIIGQDPYHGDGQANGLSFSVNETVPIPPSLLNMYKEIERDLGKQIPDSGNLLHWAKQGVLLLNATLTVEAHKAGSHQGKGWELFTDVVIQTLSEEKEHLVFMLWGAFAKKKGASIPSQKHMILETSHPSPLSVYRGFLGCGHFSKANAYLLQNGMTEIKW